MTEQITNFDTVKVALENSISDLQAQRDTLSDENEQQSAEIDFLNSTEVSLRSQIDILESEKAAIIAQADEILGQLSVQLEFLQGEKTTLEGIVSGLETNLEDMTDDRDALQADKSELEIQVAN